MGQFLDFASIPPQPGMARGVSAFVPGGPADGGQPGPLLRITAALGYDRVGLEWITDKAAHGMHFTAAQARTVAGELLASADEIDGLARLAAELAPAGATLAADPQKGTP